MNKLKQNPIGVDEKIQGFQIKLYEYLGLNLNGFGRVYIMTEEGKKLPMYHKQGKDFEEVLPSKENDKIGCFFFIVDDVSEANNQRVKAKIDVVFIVDTFLGFKDIQHAADEELQNKLHDFFLKKRFFSNSEIEIKKGKKALEGIDSELNHLKPYSLIRFSGYINYINKLNNC